MKTKNNKTNKSISVWLVLNDKKKKEIFVLQKRSSNEKFSPFICQPTWAGKVERNETIEDAIKRECREELGDNFKNNFDFSSLSFISIETYSLNGQNQKSFNYLGEITKKQLLLAKIHKDAENSFVFTDKKCEIFSQNSKKNPKDNIVLFNDQYKVLKNLINSPQ